MSNVDKSPIFEWMPPSYHVLGRGIDLERLIKEKKVAVLFGAGMSLHSGLPLANDLMQYILKTLELDENDIQGVVAAQMPFEDFLKTVIEQTNRTELLKMFSFGEPNVNHRFFAKLAKKRYVRTFVTTNFDLLIERALEQEGLRRDQDFKVCCQEDDFNQIKWDDDDELIKVIKIHGCISTPNSIRITLDEVAARILSEKRMSVMRGLYSTGTHQHVLILGYSSSDAFDLTPQIESIDTPNKEISYFEHSSTDFEMEEIADKQEKNPFKRFTGKRLMCNTDGFIGMMQRRFFGEELPSDENDSPKSQKGPVVNDRSQDSIKNVADDLFCDFLFWKHFCELTSPSLESDASKLQWKQCVDAWRHDFNPGVETLISGRLFLKASHFQKALRKFEAASAIFKSHSDQKGEVISLICMGTVYCELGEFDKALIPLTQAMSVCQSSSKINANELAVCHLGLGNAYAGLENCSQATFHYEEAWGIYQKGWDGANVQKCILALGGMYDSQGDFLKAHDLYSAAIDISQTIGDKSTECRGLIGQGISCRRVGKPHQAITHFNESLKIANLLGDKKAKSAFHTNMGNVCQDLSKYQEGLDHHQKALAIDESLDDKRGIATCYIGMGISNRQLKNFKDAENYYHKALEIFHGLRDKQGEAGCCLNLANLYINDSDRAIEFAQKALTVLSETTTLQLRGECYVVLGCAYSRKDVGKAADYYRKAEVVFKETKQEDILKNVVYYNLAMLKEIKIDSKLNYEVFP